jgi:hypothetical protein
MTSVKYVDESKIIHDVGTCFAVGYTDGWAWCNADGLLLSYLYGGAGVTLVFHFCHEFCDINMDAALFICSKQE